MKSFISFLIEDIFGGYNPKNPEPKLKKTKSMARNIDELVATVGNNFTPGENTRIVKLDDNFHAAIDHHTNPENNYSYMKVRVMSSKPGHENSALLTYNLTSGGNDHFTTETGRKIKFFSGVPSKTTINVKKGVFRLPKNFLHTISDATGFGIMSGGMQSPGAISMWRKAVGHGHAIDNRVHRVLMKDEAESYPGELRRPTNLRWVSYGRMTPRNFSDAYAYDVSAKRTGNRSKVPSGRIQDIKQDEKNINDQIKMGNRAESKLLVVPRENKI